MTASVIRRESRTARVAHPERVGQPGRAPAAAPASAPPTPLGGASNDMVAEHERVHPCLGETRASSGVITTGSFC